MSYIEMRKSAPGGVSFDKKKRKQGFGSSLKWVLGGDSQCNPLRSISGSCGDYSKDRRKVQGQLD